MNEISAAPVPMLGNRQSTSHSTGHSTGAEAAAGDDAAMLLTRSGLFDAAWYLRCNKDVAAAGTNPLLHFLHQGWQEGRQPNPYFDVEFYLAANPDVAEAAINPLLHYILAGEAKGRAPGPLFDPAWYATHHMVPPGTKLLRHFLERRFTGTVSPIPEFDPAYYRATYPDIAAAANIDPFDHYLRYGYREGRDPSANFDTKFYIHRYLGGETSQNPLLHWRQWRHALQLHTTPPEHESCVFDEVRRFTRPGSLAEAVETLPKGAPRRAKILAYYLPQFHAVPENDEWWGKGFTEWTAISRGMPRFAGHYQPRIPRDLGPYDLSDRETMRRQIALAEGAGLFGFVPYFYWFNGRRLLEKPLEAFLEDRSLDFPFALMWANENWTRRWDGSENEVLISQDYREADDAALAACLARHFADPRYIRIGGRPLLMIYRAGLIPDCPATLQRLRRLFQARHGEDPILVMSQSFGASDPAEFGFDGAIEFPPHKLVSSLRTRNMELRSLDPQARGQVYAYDDVAAASLAEPAPGFPLIKTVVPGWDNDARREGNGMVLHGSTPAKYQAWLSALVDRSADHPFFGERIVCINAWNEWAEGAYLEPDIHYGAAYLNATGRAVTRPAATDAPERVLLVGHDAFPAGAQMLLLQLGRRLARSHGVAVEFLLLGDGRLVPDYAATAPTVVAKDRKALTQRLVQAAASGVTRALVNTSAAAHVIPLLRRVGIECVLLVHELPRLLAERNLIPAARTGAAAARRVIFPAACVRDAFTAVAPIDDENALVMPQGLYREIRFDPAAREQRRVELGVAPGGALVLGAGTGDMRKGFDLFLQAARSARRRRAPVHFCWIGRLDPSLADHLAPDIEAAKATGLFHLPGFQDDVGSWLSAADAFALTSREDPYPSVVLEALASGLQVAAFAGSGGATDLLADPERGLVAPTDSARGVIVPMPDADLMSEALLSLAGSRDPDIRAARAEAAAGSFDFAAYAAAVLAELRPAQPRISVAVPSHNYARFLPERLGTIFAQTHPVEEVLLLDDASTDDSVAVALATAQDWKRDIFVTVNDANGGSVFAQWQRAATLARGEYLWIAEADDAADPELIARLSRLLAAHPDMDLAFCDSRAVDAEGATVMASYKEYYRESGATALLQDGVFTACDFLARHLSVRNLILNASAVVFRTQALRDSLQRCQNHLPTWRVAGDWRLYVDILAHSTGTVAYLAAPLNIHRRHGHSATASLPPAEMIAEIKLVHAAINKALPPDPERRRRQSSYRASLAA